MLLSLSAIFLLLDSWRCTSVHIHQVPWPFPELFCQPQWVCCHFLPPRDWVLLLFTSFCRMGNKTKQSKTTSGLNPLSSFQHS
jgi:hypothetical protein